MRLINKAGLVAGALTTLLILASCSDSDTSTGVTTGRQAANDSSTQTVMHQAAADNGEHFDTGTGDGLGDRGGEANDIFPELAIAPTTPAATPETTTPVVTTPTTATTPTTTTTTPSTTTTPTSTSGGGRQAANDPEPAPATPAATTQVATTPAATTTVIVETVISADDGQGAADEEPGGGSVQCYSEWCGEAAQAEPDKLVEMTASTVGTTEHSNLGILGDVKGLPIAPNSEDGETCEIDFHVSALACVQCPDGEVNDAGDRTADGDTKCEAEEDDVDADVGGGKTIGEDGKKHCERLRMTWTAGKGCDCSRTSRSIASTNRKPHYHPVCRAKGEPVQYLATTPDNPSLDNDLSLEATQAAAAEGDSTDDDETEGLGWENCESGGVGVGCAACASSYRSCSSASEVQFVCVWWQPADRWWLDGDGYYVTLAECQAAVMRSNGLYENAMKICASKLEDCESQVDKRGL